MSETNSKVEVADVELVIGGPTGLLTGLLLHRLGVCVSILDAKSQSLDLGRADALNARTQQYLTVVGILDELLPLGLKCNTSSTFGEGEFISRQNKWWVGLEHTLHKNFLMIGQPVIEKILSNRLDGRVHYGEQVETLLETDDFVQVVAKSGHTVHAKYALGADGARSTVRAAMGATFTGTKPEMLWAVLDTFINTDFPRCPEIITFQLNGQSRVSWIPRERGLCRFYVLLEGEVTQERAEESIKKHLAPYRTEFVKTEWYSTFDVKERIASTFISRDGAGRVFLAGDAAHVHSVNGGQGLNTGIADAFSLAWRLALVINQASRLKEGAARTLLQSYDIERRQTAQGVIDVAAALVRDTVHTARQYVGTIEKNAGYITGMGVAYDGMESPAVQESGHGFWRAGKRCPDAVLSQPDVDGDIWLYSQVTYGEFLILAIGNHPKQVPTHEDTAVLFNILPSSANVEGMATSRTRTYIADWAKPNEAFAVLVRPDMYIGYVGADIESCHRYLDRLFIR
ncbi:hypothetical protein M440DRAFT_1473218 [Trichoderma longibrachiatum ATCC 18648]|uniref:FAD-binding domain-containing protein n=1 Tax=Trichoderma longibrachiatum ATCC 18648 TaxID=983965 RepID=A0A2T4BR69_TRILO|nr:hypothetical protein M440DRAFT_1473218 [Trichoderma longibrachiatum ATCC 18648]